MLNWCYRLGLAVLRRPLPRRDDWIFVIDHTVAPGALKCLVVLGIPAGRLAETGYSPRHCDMTVLAVEVTAKSTGIWVAAVLEQVSTRTGVPVQIVPDHGSDVRKGIALFRQQAPGCVETDDISHAIATQLKAHWHDDVHWQGFLKQTAATLSHFQQTELLFLLPPRQRTKARDMHVDAHLQWARRLIGDHDQGDFSAIGLPCVFSANARAQLRAAWGKRRVEPRTSSNRSLVMTRPSRPADRFEHPTLRPSAHAAAIRTTRTVRAAWNPLSKLWTISVIQSTLHRSETQRLSGGGAQDP